MSISEATDFADTALLWAGIAGIVIGGICVMYGIILGVAISAGGPMDVKIPVMAGARGVLLLAVGAAVYVLAGGTLIIGPVHIGPV